MKLEDGLYVLPSESKDTAVSVVGGIPAVESLAGGREGVRLKLEVLYPDKDFSKAKVLEKAKAAISAAFPEEKRKSGRKA